MDHLDLDDATLFLTDWGGPIGLEFARRHPERLARLVIADTGRGRSTTTSTSWRSAA
jgi:haloalkane dehalogenase